MRTSRLVLAGVLATAACTDVTAPAILAPLDLADAGGDTSPGVLPDAPAAATEYDRLKLLPRNLLESLRGSAPDAMGLVGVNSRSGWSCSAYQRGASQTMTVGAVLDRLDWIEEGLDAAEATFARQTPDGHFDDRERERAYCVGYFLADLAHALLVLRESPHEMAYRARVNALLPGVGRAARWLTAPTQTEWLLADGGRAAHQLAYYAAAMALSGVLLGDMALVAHADVFEQVLLAAQDAEGGYRVGAGTDSTFQATTLWKLAWRHLHVPSPALAASMMRAGPWQLARIDAGGLVNDANNQVTRNGCPQDSGCLELNWREVVWGLLYYGLLFDPAGIEAAARVVAAYAE